MQDVRQQVKTLTAINTQDMLTSFGLGEVRRGRWFLDLACWLPALRFARQVSAYDRRVAVRGLQAASAEALGDFARHLELVGQENIPSQGPLLVLANHPGLADTLALFASLPRPDLRCVAAVRPFLRALAHVEPHLIYVGDGSNQRVSVVRAVTDYLRQGGAVLTFPAGEIEPDPASMPGAVESLGSWSRSIGLFMRLVPALQIVPAIVSGVIWPAALHSPLTRLRHLPKDRERLAAALQILVQSLLPFYQPVGARVAYGPAITRRDLPGDPDAAAITRMVIARAWDLMETVLPGPLKFALGGQAAPDAGANLGGQPGSQPNPRPVDGD